MNPVTQDQELLAAILDELKALRGDLQRLLPQPLEQIAGVVVELKEPERKAKPKRKG